MKGLAFGAAVAVLATLVGLAAPKGQATARKLACGTDRWTVKTLQDRPHLLPNQVRTVKWLVHRPPPAWYFVDGVTIGQYAGGSAAKSIRGSRNSTVWG